jgi:hypothetical protein
MTDGHIGFLGALIGALIGVGGAAWSQNFLDVRRRKQSTRFEIYQRLLALNEHYFWVASRTLHDALPDAQVLRECYRISWEIADRLRAFDKIEYLDELASVLFSSGIATSNERANRLGALIDLYSNLVNPTFAAKMREVSTANVIAFGTGQDPKSYAPGQVPPLEVTIAGLHAAGEHTEGDD